MKEQNRYRKYILKILSRYLIQFWFNIIEYKVLKSWIFDFFATFSNPHWVDHISKFAKVIFLNFSQIILKCIINVCMNFNRTHLNSNYDIEKCVILLVSK